MKRFIAIFMTLCLVLGMSSISVWADETSEWKEEKPLTLARYCAYSCVVNDKIYELGGVDNNKSVLSVEIYEPKADTWTTGKSMPRDRKYFTGSVVGSKIYVIGGLNSNTVDIYDTLTDTWTTGHNMPTARGYLTSCAIGDKIYVIGGRNSTCLNTMEIYDTQNNTWITGKSMPTARDHLACATLDNKIYVIGGIAGSNVLNTVEIYDKQTDTWTSGKNLNGARVNLTCAVVDNKIYAIGGANTTTLGYLNTVDIYDSQTESWIEGGSMPTKRTCLSACVVNGKIYAIGGVNDTGVLNLMESLNINKSSLLSVLLNEGEQVQLSTSFNLDNNKNYTWSSTNEAVATVDANGKVTAVAEGTADIYAQNVDGTFKEYIPVKVVKGIADELRLAVHLKTGEKAKLYLTYDPSKVTWTSMSESIATVSTDGQVTGVKKGLAIVKAELDGQAYQIYVRVTDSN
nr:kelch repeat-containing protein [uncultured Aminipila sp.]